MSLYAECGQLCSAVGWDSLGPITSRWPGRPFPLGWGLLDFDLGTSSVDTTADRDRHARDCFTLGDGAAGIGRHRSHGLGTPTAADAGRRVNEALPGKDGKTHRGYGMRRGSLTTFGVSATGLPPALAPFSALSAAGPNSVTSSALPSMGDSSCKRV